MGEQKIEKHSVVDVLTFGVTTRETVVSPDTYGDGKFITTMGRTGRTYVVERARATLVYP